MRLLVAPIIVAIGFACGCALPDFGGSDAAAPGPVERAQARAARLSDSELVGQRLVAGFAGESIPDDLRRSIGDGLLGGVVLFDENFDGQAGARRLIAELQSIPRPRGLAAPLLVMLDQEGGLVRRLPGPPAASAERMGAGGTPECRRQGAETAAMLKRAGVNVDLAPVLDVARAGGALDLEQRSFGRDPDTVASCAGAFAAALERGGVAPTAKHFPGLGAARVNTDDAVQRIDLGRSTLRGVDERPYRGFAGAGSGGRLVMLSSAVYPAFSELPAALSRELASDELRGRLGFEGPSITDALETASTEAVGGSTAAAKLAARAGTDLMLFTDLGDARRAAKPLRAMLRSSAATRREYIESVGRVLALRERLRAPG